MQEYGSGASQFAESAVGLSLLQEMLAGIKAKSITLFLDVCHNAEDEKIQRSVISKYALRCRPDFPELIHKYVQPRSGLEKPSCY